MSTGADQTAMGDELNRTEYRALAEFKYRLRCFLASSDHAALAAGLQPQQYLLLLAVKAAPDERPTMGHLADRLQLRPHSTVELVDRLQKNGLVMRAPGAGDRRRVYVQLTAHGQASVRAAASRNWADLKTSAVGLLQAIHTIINLVGDAG